MFQRTLGRISTCARSNRNRRNGRRLRTEPLEVRRLLAGDLLITEFMAANDDTLADADGDYPDWIEIYNAGALEQNLDDWALTDRADNLDKWRFPPMTIVPGEHLVVFASGKDRNDPAGELHTDFALNAGGEYLALVRPDGTIEHEYTPTFPPQIPDISYGPATDAVESQWMDTGAEAKYWVPTDDTLGLSWTTPGFDDAAWSDAVTGIGYYSDSAVGDTIEAPTEIVGNVLWLDASDNAAVVEAVDQPGFVQQWLDKSSAGNHLSQASVDRRPAVGADTLGDLDVITLDGVNDHLAGSAVLEAGDDTYTYFALWRPHVNNVVQSVYEQAGPGAHARSAILAVNTAYGFNGQNNDAHSMVPLAANQWRLTAMTVDNSGSPNIHVVDNGNSYSATTTGFGGPADLNVGIAGVTVGRKQQVDGEFLNGDLAELIVYDRVLSSEEIVSVSDYLDTKFSLTPEDDGNEIQDPTEIDGAVLWLDANDVDGDGTAEGTGEDSIVGGLVSSWADKSGQGNTVAQTAGAPELVENVLNSGTMPVLRFDGTDALTRAVTTGLPAGNAPRSMFFVANDGGKSTTGYAAGYGGTAANLAFTYDFNRDAGTRVVGWSNDYETGFTASSQHQIWGVQYDGTTVRTFRDNDEGNSPSTTFNTESRNIRIGEWVNGGINFVGDLAEVIIYDSNLTDAQRDDVIDYLDRKYGLNEPVEPTLPPDPVHQWTFEDGTADDSVGTTHGTLNNGATIVDGRLELDGINDYMSTAALADATGAAETIAAKTLVAWVGLDNLTQSAGGVLTIENPTDADVFDGIVFGEAAAGKWMSGSNNFLRTDSPQSFGSVEAVIDPEIVMVAIAYGTDNSITVYRDGLFYGRYTKGTLQTYSTANGSDVLLGLRHADRSADVGTAGGPDAFLAGGIEEARIYNTALSAGQIATLAAEGPVGYESPIGEFPELIATDVLADMAGTNASLYARIEFEVPDAAAVSLLRLEMRYDDGFIAYVNGVEVSRRNAPDPAGWDSEATAVHPNWQAVLPEDIIISVEPGLLETGTNVLALHGLNASVDSPDFLLLPELFAIESITVHADSPVYFEQPTPGRANGTGTEDLGAIISEVTENVPAAADDADLVVTARVLPSFHDVADVTLHWRVMYQAENIVAMLDDGIAPDALASDGVYSALIPNTASSPGQMVRWRVTATDVEANASRWPLFLDPLNSPEYAGTMIDDPGVSSNLPILNWFVQNPGAAQTDGGTRASAYFNGEFYDNFFVRHRGMGTRSWAKRKFKFDFNPNEHFRYDEVRPRVEEFNLQSHYGQEFGQTSYMRETLAYRFLNDAGTPASTAMHWQIRQNGEFFGLYSFIEQIDETFLERHGIDPDAPMYKADQNGTLAPTYQGDPRYRKANQKSEPWDDLIELTDALSNLGGMDRNTFLFDRVDLPQIINEMAAHVMTPNHDRLIKNYYVYLDPDTDQWNRVPWDVEQSFAIGAKLSGDPWGNLYFGDEQHVQEPGHADWFNYMHDAVLDNPVTREMYVRRVRSLMDQFMGPSAAENDYFETIITDWRDLIYDEAAADHAKWGAGLIDNGVNGILNTTLPTRRNFLYSHPDIPSSQIGGNTIERTTLLAEGAEARVLVPDAAFDTINGTNWRNLAFDDSQAAGWTWGATGVGYEENTGYEDDIVLDLRDPARPIIDLDQDGTSDNDTIYVRIPFTVDNPGQFDSLRLRMKYDDGFVAFLNGQRVAGMNDPDLASLSWNSGATANTPGDTTGNAFQTFNLGDPAVALLDGVNVLAIHGLNDGVTSSDMIVLPELEASVTIPGNSARPTIDVAEIDYNPLSGNQDEEYVKLENPNGTSVDISGWRLAGGVEHTFEPGTVIPAGGSLYVTPSLIAFRGRAAGPTGGQQRFVVGNYSGHLANAGETLTLLSDDGSFVSELTYQGVLTEVQQYLRVSELMYNPPDLTAQEVLDGFTDHDQFEFIELTNTSDDTTLNLAGVRLTGGVVFDFTDSAITSLAPGEFVLVVKQTDAMTYRYGAQVESFIAGQYTGGLKNDNEQLKIEDATNSTVAQFTYKDGPKWPQAADGDGSSLVPISLDADLDEWESWHASIEINGSPGQDAAALVIGRHVFFDGSSVDTGGSEGDNAAIATDKTALLPGIAATFENLTSYSSGINGLMIDVAHSPAANSIDATDLAFAIGNDDTPIAWQAVAANSIDVREGAGRGGADRIVVAWSNGVVENTWLEVRVLAAGSHTGLGNEDVFYFGNAVGETGDSASNTLVNAGDVIAIRDNPRGPANPASIDNPYDIDRDGLVDATDMILARDNTTSPLSALPLIAPGEPLAPPEGEGESALATGAFGSTGTSSLELLDGLMAVQVDHVWVR